MKKLTLRIPTCDRPKFLSALLSGIFKQIKADDLADKAAVRISDNSSYYPTRSHRWRNSPRF